MVVAVGDEWSEGVHMVGVLDHRNLVRLKEQQEKDRGGRRRKRKKKERKKERRRASMVKVHQTNHFTKALCENKNTST